MSSDDDKPTERATWTKLKAISVAVLAGIVGCGLGYGAGYLHGWIELGPVEEARDEAQAQVAQLEARRQMALALEAIDAQDMGVAQRHLDEARRVLEASPQAQDSEISTLAGHLGAVEPSADQRVTIRRLASRLDELQSTAAGAR